jgi:hypothetical protein
MPACPYCICVYLDSFQLPLLHLRMPRLIPNVPTAILFQVAKGAKGDSDANVSCPLCLPSFQLPLLHLRMPRLIPAARTAPAYA